MAIRLDDLTLNRGGMAMGEQSQPVTKYNNPTQRTAASQSAPAPNPSGLDQSANARVNRALAIRQGSDTGGGLAYDNANQTTRGAAESVANPAIAESLRRSLIEQQRLSGPTYGSQSLGDRRARARAIQSNQANVTAGLGAMGQMRTAQVTAEGNRIGADADVLSRRLMEAGDTERTAMTEAGANSRSLLESETSRFNAGLLGDSNAEVARIQGQNQIDLRGTLTPAQQRGMDLFSDMDQVVGASGDEQALATLRSRQANTLLTGQPFSGEAGPGARTTTFDAQGNEIDVRQAFGDPRNEAILMKERIGMYNLSSDMEAQVLSLVANGDLAPESVPAYAAQVEQEAIAKRAAEKQAAMDARTPRQQASRERLEARLDNNPRMRDRLYVGGLGD